MDKNDDLKNAPNDLKVPGNNFFRIILIGFIITSLLNIFGGYLNANRKVLIDYSKFMELAQAGVVDRATVGDEEIIITLKEDVDVDYLMHILPLELGNLNKEEAYNYYKDTVINQKFYTGTMRNDLFLTDKLLEYGVIISPVITESNPILEFVVGWIFPILFIYFVYSFMIKSVGKRLSNSGQMGGMFNVGKSKAKVYDMENETGITFKDVAGQEEAKESLEEIVDFLHNPEKYDKIGAKQPKGALLVGPPGTGKTLLAKAVAGEAKVPFFSLSGSDFIEMYVGVGASRVRDLFAEAVKKAPSIIFIDEIDAIGKSRDQRAGGNDEREQTLNQLLAEMDGFESSKGIVVLAATNRPEVLDKALLRPGRFDRRVIVEKPDLSGREAILKLHGVKVIKDDTVDFREIALATSGATGADLANMVNEAALRAVRLNKDKIDQSDLMESVEVVIAGKEKKDRILGKTERRIVAFHEVGHALASAKQKNTMPVQKITIVPRTMGSLGYTMNVPEEEKYLMSKEEILSQIVTLLAGRAAEEVIFNTSTTGASNDIEKATKLARAMITQYGMSEEFDMVLLEQKGNQYLDGENMLACSQETGAKIDKEVTAIIKACHQKAISILEANRDKLTEISEFLLEKETITGKQFMDILNTNA